MHHTYITHSILLSTDIKWLTWGKCALTTNRWLMCNILASEYNFLTKALTWWWARKRACDSLCNLRTQQIISSQSPIHLLRLTIKRKVSDVFIMLGRSARGPTLILMTVNMWWTQECARSHKDVGSLPHVVLSDASRLALSARWSLRATVAPGNKRHRWLRSPLSSQDSRINACSAWQSLTK